MLLGIALFLGFFWIIFWCRQFSTLMLLSDSDFPGKYDKILWFGAFFLGFFVAPLAFSFWKYAYLEFRLEEKKTAASSMKEKYEAMRNKECAM